MYSKPNVKYYSNSDMNQGKVVKKTIAHKTDEELKQKVKQLEY